MQSSGLDHSYAWVWEVLCEQQVNAVEAWTMYVSMSRPALPRFHMSQRTASHRPPYLYHCGFELQI